MKKKDTLLRQLTDWWIGEELAQLGHWVRYRRMQRKFRHAIKTAIQLHRLDSRTYYVIRGDNVYMVWSSEDIRRLKDSGAIYRNLTIRDIYATASYTASSNKDLKGGDVREVLRKEYERIKTETK